MPAASATPTHAAPKRDSAAQSALHAFARAAQDDPSIDDSPPPLDAEENKAVGMRTRPGSSPRGKDTAARSHAGAPPETPPASGRKKEGTIERLDAGLCGRRSPIKRGRACELDRTAHYTHSPLSHATPTSFLPSPPLLACLPRPRRGVGERARAPFLCCNGGSAGLLAPGRHVHRLRCDVLRVQVGREPGGDAEGHRLRVRQGRRLHPDHLQRALLPALLRRRPLLLRLQQLLPEERRHGRHLRLHGRRHPRRRRPQRRILQVPRQRKRRGHWSRHRRHGHRHRDRRDGGRHRRHGNRHRQHRNRHGRRHRHRRHGEHDPARRDQHRDAGEPLRRRRVRPVGHEPGLQRGRGGSPRGRRGAPRGRCRAAPPPLRLMRWWPPVGWRERRVGNAGAVAGTTPDSVGAPRRFCACPLAQPPLRRRFDGSIGRSSASVCLSVCP